MKTEDNLKVGFANAIKDNLKIKQQIKEMEEGLMFAKADGHAKQTIIESQENYIKELEEEIKRIKPFAMKAMINQHFNKH